MSIFYHFLLISLITQLISGVPIQKRDTISEEDSWILELESQIIPNSKPKNVSTAPRPPLIELPPIVLDYDNATEVQEPIVVTAKPYLTGADVSQDEDMTEKTTDIDDSSAIATDEDVERVRAILDKILSQVPSQPPPKQSPDEDDFIRQLKNESEVKTFVVLLKNQTLIIIFGCVLSLIILTALVVSVYHILKRVSENSAITLIAHYEYDETAKVKVQRIEEEWSKIDLH